MKNKIDKILAVFGNIGAMERLHIDNFTEDIIKSIEAKPFGISDKNVIYATFNELGGYFYLKTMIVGNFNIKTLKGAILKIKSEAFELDLKSDMDELKSDFSNVSGRYITNIDFEVEKEDIDRLNTNAIKHFILSSKKTKVEFSSYHDENPTS